MPDRSGPTLRALTMTLTEGSSAAISRRTPTVLSVEGVIDEEVLEAILRQRGSNGHEATMQLANVELLVVARSHDCDQLRFDQVALRYSGLEVRPSDQFFGHGAIEGKSSIGVSMRRATVQTPVTGEGHPEGTVSRTD